MIEISEAVILKEGNTLRCGLASGLVKGTDFEEDGLEEKRIEC